MKSAFATKRKQSGLARRYQAALGRYLRGGPAASLRTAGRLGRQTIALGLETLDLALIHEQALIGQALPTQSPAVRERIIRRAGIFFSEAILPMEATHRAAQEAAARLRRLNRALNQRSLDLAASNRTLLREIARRHVVEASLRRSERRTRQLLEQSQRLQEQRRLLSRQVLSAQEEERKRISRELHDVIAQMLTGINVRLATLKAAAAADASDLARSISGTQRLVEKSVDVVHQFARELRPAMLDDLGLIPTLHSFMKRFAKETAIKVSLTAFAGLEKLSSAKRTALFRVAQEALANVARHAHASRVEASIRRLPGAVCMRIKDDGDSFAPERVGRSRQIQHLGLLGMRERVEMVGGKFSVEALPGQGTTIVAQIPFPPARKRARS